jgi:hypothetical protein
VDGCEILHYLGFSTHPIHGMFTINWWISQQKSLGFSWFFHGFSRFFMVFHHQTDPSLSSDSDLFDLIRPHDVAGVAK